MKRPKWQPAVRRAALFLMLIGMSPLQATGPEPGERLDYTFSYQGVLSGFIEIDIARATFGVGPAATVIDDRQTYLATMELSTEPFKKAELLYPIRFRYRSWLEPARQTPLLVQEYMKTDEISEELLWFDWKVGSGYHFEKTAEASGQATGLPTSILQQLGISPADWQSTEESDRQPLEGQGVWDYLSLLYRLRFMELLPGAVVDLPLYNGKRIKTYRVEVERERLQKAGWDHDAFKLNLYEVRGGRRKGDSVTAIWISDNDQRRPLRFHVARSFGVFEGILETGRPLTSGNETFSESTRQSLQLVF